MATRLPGLRRLELRLEYLGSRVGFGVEKDWVKTMMRVRQMKEVVVEILFRADPWTGVRCEEVEREVGKAWLRKEKEPIEE